MGRLQQHLRNTFLTGIFAAIPLAVTAFVIWYVERQTRDLFHVHIPFLGVAIAIGGIYLLGLFVSSLLGRWLLRRIDRLLLRMPVLRELYRAWKHVSLTPGGKEGVFSKVVLIPIEGDVLGLGFSSGDPIPSDPGLLCVFVPASPNPIQGRILFVPVERCIFLEMSTEEGFKLLLSGGNYLPETVRRTALAEGQPLVGPPAEGM